MSKIVVMAFPEDAAKVAVINDIEKLDEAMCWGYEIMPTLMEMRAKHPDVSKIVFMGPRTYVEPFALNAQTEFANLEVEIGAM